MTESVALIPARGGSRRIPRKNLRPFLGVPAIQRTIRTVRESAVADRVIVSTDDDEIAVLSRDVGADVPGLRPAALADDYATTIEVVRHAVIEWLADIDRDAVLWVIYPAALLLRPGDLEEARTRFRDSGSSFLVPVLRYPHPIERRLRIASDGVLRADCPDKMFTRTQDLKPAFHDSGQFYVGRISSWLESSPLVDPRSVGMELAAGRAVDIDEPEDWERAERLAELARD